MKPADVVMIHWTGGLGMFNILVGEIWTGIAVVIVAHIGFLVISWAARNRGNRR